MFDFSLDGVLKAIGVNKEQLLEAVTRLEGADINLKSIVEQNNILMCMLVEIGGPEAYERAKVRYATLQAKQLEQITNDGSNDHGNGTTATGS